MIYRATVIDNNDPELLQAVRVTCAALYGTKASGWVRSSVPIQGSETPSVGDHVWLVLEDNDLSKPVWLGKWLLPGDDIGVTGGTGLIIAKQTMETPWGRPGLYSLDSTFPSDGAWINVGLANSNPDFVISDGSDALRYIEIGYNNYSDAAWFGYIDLFLQNDAEDKTAEVYTYTRVGEDSAYSNAAPMMPFTTMAAGTYYYVGEPGTGLELYASDKNTSFWMRRVLDQNVKLIDIVDENNDDIFTIDYDLTTIWNRVEEDNVGMVTLDPTGGEAKQTWYGTNGTTSARGVLRIRHAPMAELSLAAADGFIGGSAAQMYSYADDLDVGTYFRLGQDAALPNVGSGFPNDAQSDWTVYAATDTLYEGEWYMDLDGIDGDDRYNATYLLLLSNTGNYQAMLDLECTSIIASENYGVEFMMSGRSRPDTNGGKADFYINNTHPDNPQDDTDVGVPYNRRRWLRFGNDRVTLDGTVVDDGVWRFGIFDKAWGGEDEAHYIAGVDPGPSPQAAAISDAAGTLGQATTAINAVLAALRAYGWIAE